MSVREATHQSLNRHDSARTVTQVSQTSADASRRRLHVQAILLIYRRTDVVLQILGGDLDVDGVRDLHRLALDRGDHTLRLILVGGRMRRRRLRRGRVVDWCVLLLDRRR